MSSHVKHKAGDSDLDIKGSPSVASRSTITAGTAVRAHRRSRWLRRGKTLAAHVLEADEKDIAYAAGAFTVIGTDRQISLFDLAATAVEMKEKGERIRHARHQVSMSDVRRRPSRTAATSPKSRSNRRPARLASSPVTLSMIAAPCSTPTLVQGQVQGALAQGPRTGLA